MGQQPRRPTRVSHLYRYYLNGQLVAASTPGAERLREPPHAEGSFSTSAPSGGSSLPPAGGTNPIQGAEVPSGAVVVVQPDIVPIPIAIEPVDTGPVSIIPAVVQEPTILLVGSESGGGMGMPWEIGPATLPQIPLVIGSLLFYKGNTLQAAMGIRDPSGLFKDATVSYYARNCYLRIHTGIGSYEGASVGVERVPNQVVPFNAPHPPQGAIEGPQQQQDSFLRQLLEGGEHGSGQTHQDPDSGVLDRFGETVEELFKFFAPWEQDFGSWLF